MGTAFRAPQHPFYGDLTVISPTVISTNPWISNNTLNSTPLATYSLDNHGFLSEKIVGEIAIKSPYDS